MRIRPLIMVTMLLLAVGMIATFGVGQTVHKVNPEIDIYNFTLNKQEEYRNVSIFLSGNIYSLEDYKNESSDVDFFEMSTNRLMNIVWKGTIFFIDTTIELVSWGTEFGFNNPQYDYDYGIYIVKWAIIVILGCAFITPAFYLIVLLGVLIHSIVRKRRTK